MKKNAPLIGKKIEKSDMKLMKGGSQGTPDSTLEGGVGGGPIICWIHPYGSSGQALESYGLILNNSSEANAHCTTQVITAGTGVYRCKYDCGQK